VELSSGLLQVFLNFPDAVIQNCSPPVIGVLYDNFRLVLLTVPLSLPAVSVSSFTFASIVQNVS
jgi:hypothetical protein